MSGPGRDAEEAGGTATGGRLGKPRIHYRLVGSTNEEARRLGEGGAPHGTLVTAAEQRSGRGRQGRRWEAPPQTALLASVLVRDLDERHAVLPLAVAVAACEACEESAPVQCRIKWPNDVWIERRKVAGVLIEGRPQERWAVIGVGINVTTPQHAFPAELRETATSLAPAASDAAAPSVEAVLDHLLHTLAARLEDPAEEVLAAWRGRDALRGEPVAWAGGEGVALGVGDDGALLVDTPEGRVALDAGEVHLGTER